MTLPERPYFLPVMKRHVIIATSVLLFHIAALWALQNGLLHRAVEIIVPIEILSEFIAPPAPQVVPPLPAPPVPVKQPLAKALLPTPLPVPQPAPIPEAQPAPNAPTSVTTPQPPAPSATAPVAAAPAAPPAPARVALPSSDAEYLQNPKPPYPAISKRLGEQGKVVVRVLIGVDGTAQKAEIRQSSGFDRLDQAALNTVLRWRYVPGRRGGAAEVMWFNVPINFVLE